MGDAKGVSEAWEDLLTSKIFPDTGVYNQFLMLYGRQHNTSKMNDVLESMMKHVPPNPVTATTVIDMLGKTGRIGEMEALFEDMKTSPDTTPTSVTYHQMLNAYAKSGDVSKMQRIYDEFKSKGFEENGVTFNILIEGYGRAKRFEQMQEVLAQRKDKGVPLDDLTFCVLIASYGRVKLTAELDKVAEQLKQPEHIHLLTRKVIWSFIDAYCRCADVQRMETWIQELAKVSESGQLTSHDEMILLGFYCRAGSMDFVESSAEKIEARGVELTYGALNAMAKGFARQGRLDKTVAVLHRMRDRNVVPDASTTLYLSSSFLKAGLPEQAHQVVEWRRQYSKVAGEDVTE